MAGSRSTASPVCHHRLQSEHGCREGWNDPKLRGRGDRPRLDGGGERRTDGRGEGLEEIALYRELLAAGKLPLRVYAMAAYGKASDDSLARGPEIDLGGR